MLVIKYVLALCLASGPAYGLEETSGASVEASTEGTLAALMPASSLEILSTVAVVLAISATLYTWNHVATKRAYARAADEAREALSQNADHPISGTPPDSVLRRAADVERERMRLAGEDPSQVDEIKLALIIIARANAFAARP